MAEYKILICPFCGGDPEVVNNNGAGGMNECPPSVFVRCKGCGVMTPHCFRFDGSQYSQDLSIKAALSAWNRRAKYTLKDNDKAT